VSNDGDLFEAMLLAEAKLELEKITKDAKRLLKEKVQTEVYSSYSPTSYTRTNDLINSVTSTVSETEGLVFFDESSIGHTSAVTGDKVGMYTPKFLDGGHSDGKGSGMYHEYPERNFIDKTIVELEAIYGKNCVEKIDN